MVAPGVSLANFIVLLSQTTGLQLMFISSKEGERIYLSSLKLAILRSQREQEHNRIIYF